MDTKEIIVRLKKLENKQNVEGMARFGISSNNTLGVSVKVLRDIRKEIRSEVESKKAIHSIALELWESGIHEARMLATIIDVPELVTEKQADAWVRDIESWDICDGFCLNLIDKTPFAFNKVKQWVQEEKEFTRRAAFSLLAGLAVHHKSASNSDFEKFLPLIKKYATDDRNFVRKSVNWALRQIGKRNNKLLHKAIDLAEELLSMDSKSAKWVGKDALRELKGKLNEYEER